MEAKANEILIQLLQRAVDGVDQAVAFSQAQIPDVVAQLLVWNALKSGILFVLGIFLIIASKKIWSTLKSSGEAKLEKVQSDFESGKPWTRYLKGSEIGSMKYDLAVTFCGTEKYIALFSALAGIIICSINADWLKIWIAPKLYLLEYAADLVK